MAAYGVLGDELYAALRGAVQEKVWVSDPDGHAWEIFLVLGDTAALERDVKTSTPVGSTCCAPRCCE